MHLGQYQQAWAHEQIGFDLSREIGYRRGVAIALGVLGSVASAVEAHTEARQRLKEAVAIYRELGQQDAVGWTLASLGIAERGLGHFPQAQQYLCQALQTAAKIGAFVPLTTALPGSVLLLADQGKEEQAVELYALAASRFPAVANSRWFEDVVGRHIAAVAATLSPEVVAAAQRRGQARDLWATVEELLDELG